jgi:hypothetical protein
MNTQEQIKEKVYKYFPEILVVSLSDGGETRPSTAREDLIGELTNLLTQQREEAVRGFGKWFDGGSGQFDSKIETYLSQQREKGE